MKGTNPRDGLLVFIIIDFLKNFVKFVNYDLTCVSYLHEQNKQFIE